MEVAENLKQFGLQAGAIYVHDSGYGYRDRVAQSSQAGAYRVTAFSPGSFPSLRGGLSGHHGCCFALDIVSARWTEQCCRCISFNNGRRQYLKERYLLTTELSQEFVCPSTAQFV